jgi:hypothetical protein
MCDKEHTFKREEAMRIDDDKIGQASELLDQQSTVKVGEVLGHVVEALQGVVEMANKPKRVIRDENGMIAGVE